MSTRLLIFMSVVLCTKSFGIVELDSMYEKTIPVLMVLFGGMDVVDFYHYIKSYQD